MHSVVWQLLDIDSWVERPNQQRQRPWRKGIHLMIVSCPECNNKLRVNVEMKTKPRIRCPKCSKTFVLNTNQEDEDNIERPSVKSKARRGPDDEEDDDRPRRRRDEEDEEEEFEERPRRRKKARKKAPILLWSVIGGSLAVLVAGIVTIVLLASRSRGSALEQHEAAVREAIAVSNELGAALETVKDKDSARAAAAKINQICDRMEALARRERSLPRLTAEENLRLQNLVNAEVNAMKQRLTAAGFQAGMNSQGEPSFVAAARRLQALKK